MNLSSGWLQPSRSLRNRTCNERLQDRKATHLNDSADIWQCKNTDNSCLTVSSITVDRFQTAKCLVKLNIRITVLSKAYPSICKLITELSEYASLHMRVISHCIALYKLKLGTTLQMDGYPHKLHVITSNYDLFIVNRTRAASSYLSKFKE